MNLRQSQQVNDKGQQTLRKTLDSLRTKNKDDRIIATKRVRRYLEQESRSRSSESFARVLKTVIAQMEVWKKTSSSTDSLACTILINEIVHMAHPEVKNRNIQVVVINLLTRIVQQEASGRIPSSDKNAGLVALESACHVLGTLATGPASVTSFFVERESKKAIAWLNAKTNHEMKRLAAVLMLKEFALNAPTLFNIHSEDFFGSIYSALCDKHLRIRFTASIALRYALRVIAQREARQKYKLYNDIWELARKQFPDPYGSFSGARSASTGSRGGVTSPRSRRFSKLKRAAAGSKPSSLFGFISGSGNGSTASGDALHHHHHDHAAGAGAAAGAGPGANGDAGPSASSHSSGQNFRNAAALHGALLGFYELIGECTGEFIRFRFDEIFDQCIWLPDVRFHSDPLVRETVMMILPRLALHCPDPSSVAVFLSQSLRYLISSASSSPMNAGIPTSGSGQGLAATSTSSAGQHRLTATWDRGKANSSSMPSTPPPPPPSSTPPISSPVLPSSASTTSNSSANGTTNTDESAKSARVSSRPAAFRALGQMSTLNKASAMIESHLLQVIETIRDGLTATPKWPFCPEALYCLRLLLQSHDVVSVLGSNEPLRALIPYLFGGGLSEGLVATLAVLTDTLANDAIVLQARLLQEVTAILSVSAVRGGKKNRAFQQHVQEKQFKLTRKLALNNQLETETLSSYVSRRESAANASHASASHRSARADSRTSDNGSSMREVWKDFKWRAANFWANTGTTVNSNVLKQKSEKEQYADTDPSAQMQILALRTLSTFKFESIDLIPILVSLVARHFEAVDPRVRMEACRAAGYVLTRALAAHAATCKLAAAVSGKTFASGSPSRILSKRSSQSSGSDPRQGLSLSESMFAHAGIFPVDARNKDGATHNVSAASDSTKPKQQQQQQQQGRSQTPPLTSSTANAQASSNGVFVVDEEDRFADDDRVSSLDMHAVHHIMARLVMVAMTDEDVALRQYVVEDLSQRFAPILLQSPELIRSFMVLTNDRNFEVRAVAVDALGCFASQAPSRIMPSVHTVLLRHLNELNFAVEPKHREESVMLLGLLIRSLNPALARPHISTVIDTLLPKIHRVHRGVATAMLATLGEVARVGDEATLSPLLARVLPIIVTILDDGSSSTFLKREVALSTLAIMASNAALPIWPYLCFPQLLQSILKTMVMPGAPIELRKQAMITYGVLGALDPWLFTNHQQLAAEGVGSSPEGESAASIPKLLLAFGGSRDLPAAVLQAFAARKVDSDDEADDSSSEPEEEVYFTDSFVEGSSFDLDSHGQQHSYHASANTTDGFGSGSFRALSKNSSSLQPPATLFADHNRPLDTAILSGARATTRSGWQSGDVPGSRPTPAASGGLWGSRSRRTSYLVKSDLYPVPGTSSETLAMEESHDSLSKGINEAAILHSPQPSVPAHEVSPVIRPVPRPSSAHLPSTAFPGLPPLPPPPPPPGPPPADAFPMSGLDQMSSILGGDQSGARRTLGGANFGHSGALFPSAGPQQSQDSGLMMLTGPPGVTGTNAHVAGVPPGFIPGGAHRRAATANPTFQDTLTSSSNQARRASARALNGRGRGRRKSSIRVVAQQINVMSHTSKNKRRQSTLYQFHQAPSRSTGAENLSSKPGDHSFAASAANRPNVLAQTPVKASTISVSGAAGTRADATKATGPATASAAAAQSASAASALDEAAGANSAWHATNGAQVFTGAAAYAAAAANQQIQDQLADEEVQADLLDQTSASAILPSAVQMNAEYYPRVAITALSKVLARSQLEHEEHLMSAIEAINRVFRALESNFSLFLPLVMPRLIHVIQRAGLHGRPITSKKLQELSFLVKIVKDDITPYVAAIFELNHEIWNGKHKIAIVHLVDTLVDTLSPDALRPYMATVLDDMLSLLHSERDALQFVDSTHVLHVLSRFRSAIDEHLYLVIPTLCALIDSTLVPLEIRAKSVNTLKFIIRSCNVSEYASLIIHPIVHALEDCKAHSAAAAASVSVPESSESSATEASSSTASAAEQVTRNKGERTLFILVMEALESLVFRLEEDFAVYVSLVEKALGEVVASGLFLLLPGSPHSTTGIVGKEGAAIESYLALVSRVLRGQALDRPKWLNAENEVELLYLEKPLKESATRKTRTQSMIRSHSMDLSQLKPAWHTAQISTEAEWLEWMRRFTLALLRQSPIEAIYVCHALAETYDPVARELFNAAFLSCWDNLEGNARDSLVDQMELAMKSPKIPKDLLQVFLGLVDFMEHDDKPLPIDLRVLSDVAIRCQAYAKALRFKELEFRTVPEDCIEKLININNNLEMHHAAAGVVLFARSHFSETTEVKPLWYERLQKWDEALQAYDQKMHQLECDLRGRQPSSSRDGLSRSSWPVKEQLNLTVGRLRCLNKVGGWNSVLSLLEGHWAELREIDQSLARVASSPRDDSAHSPRADATPSSPSSPGSAPRPPVLSHFLPKFRGSSDHLAILDPSLGNGDHASGRRRSLDEGPGGTTSTLGQPIGVLMRNRSHASSSVVSHNTDDELSESRLGALRLAYGEDEVTGPRSPKSATERPQPELKALFGQSGSFGPAPDNAKSASTYRIFSSLGGKPPTSYPQPLVGLSSPVDQGPHVPDQAYVGAVRATSPFDAAGDSLSPVSRDIRDYYKGMGAFSGVVSNEVEKELSKHREVAEVSGYSQEISQRSNMATNAEQSTESDLRWYAQKLATIGGLASYALGKWENLARFVPYLDTNRTDGCTLNVILALHEGRLEHAQTFIDHSYTILDKALTSLVAESYGRAYPHLIQVQHMVELQEILDYKKLLRQENTEEAKLYLNRLRRVWSARLQGVQNTASSYMLILAYRSIIVDPVDDLDTWLHFAKIARKEKLLNLSLQALMRLGIGANIDNQGMSLRAEGTRSLTALLDYDEEKADFQFFSKEDMSFHMVTPSERGRAHIRARKFKVKPRVAFAYVKYIWASGHHVEAVHRLRRLRLVLMRCLEADHPLDLGLQSSSFLCAEQATREHARDDSGQSSNDGSMFASSSRRLRKLRRGDKVSEEAGSPRSAFTSGDEEGSGDLSDGGDVFASNEPKTSAAVVGDANALFSMSDLDQLRAEMNAADEAEGKGPRVDESDADLEDYLIPDLQALDVNFQRKDALRKLVVQCSNKLGAWLIAVKDKQAALAPSPRDTDSGSRPPVAPQQPMERAPPAQNGRGGANHGSDARPTSPPGSPRLGPVPRPRARARRARMSITATIHKGYDSTSLRGDSLMSRDPLLLEEQSKHIFGQILQCYRDATDLDPNNYKAWHAWALANFRASVSPQLAAAHADGEAKTDEGGALQDQRQFVVPAINGFFRSISLGRERGIDVLQDILRLLTLWFSHYEEEAVKRSVHEGFGTLEIDVWLGVIPQLIARLKTDGDLVCELLLRIGEAHPQTLIYPLTVASKSDDPARSAAAKHVIRGMHNLYPALAEEAIVVSRELIRIAVLWHEKWYVRLEDASRAYFTENPDVDAMAEILISLHHDMDEDGPQTLHEVAFVQAYGLNLEEAAEWLWQFKASGNKNKTFLDQAWDLYYGVFRQIKQQLQHKQIELRNVSPILLRARDLQLAVPGTYQVGAPVIRIAGFEPSVRIITSKQRPRVITIMGSDGFSHMFLLKGNEDLRMDERVMQLFGLVNGLLHLDEDTSKLGLEIQRYAVVPLSSSSGVVEWVPHTDTLHRLIEEYRESRRIPIQVEHKLMNEFYTKYDDLTVMQKVEIFQHALNNTSGQDLARVLWLKSPNSEVWIDRRTNYTRSLAAMSMVGYILGLGDRHPSNLMLERSSGRILHIDFGDCFESTMHRENFPETVPFRLTRMLVKAMEASGIDGTFRHTCHAVMHVLRGNHESILTMLEAFVYDPLVSWRILNPEKDGKEGDIAVNASAAVAEARASNDATANGFPSISARTEIRRPSASSDKIAGSGPQKPEKSTLNQRAVDVIDRVRDKLQGTDFACSGEVDGEPSALSVKEQVEKLINQATSHENLAQLYRGWSACW